MYLHALHVLSAYIKDEAHLRKELPYGRFLGYVLKYAIIGGIMLAAVRVAARILPWGGWLGLGVQVIVGITVFGGLSFAVWKMKRER